MRVDAVLADRRKEVRDAAQGWRRADAIDHTTLAAIEAIYPDDRIRLRPAFRILAFIFTVVATSALFGLFMVAAPRSTEFLWMLLLGCGLTVVTEFQIGVRKRCQGGIEEATAFMGVGFLVGGSAWLLYAHSVHGALLPIVVKAGNDTKIFLGLTVLLFAAAAAHWGYWQAGSISVLSFFLLLAHARFGRLLWIVAALVLIPLATAGGESARLAPAHRRSCQAVLIVSLLAFYISLNFALWDKRFFGWLDKTEVGDDPLFRITSIVATTLTPLVVLVFGIESRRRIFLNLGLLFAIASLATLRFYFQLAPLWVVLSLSGSVAIILGLALRRFLDSGIAKERAGFTAEPLFEDVAKHSPLEVAATMVSLSPEARTIPTEPDKFTGGGGRTGGGGASGNF